MSFEPYDIGSKLSTIRDDIYQAFKEIKTDLADLRSLVKQLTHLFAQFARLGGTTVALWTEIDAAVSAQTSQETTLIAEIQTIDKDMAALVADIAAGTVTPAQMHQRAAAISANTSAIAQALQSLQAADTNAQPTVQGSTPAGS